MNIKVLKCEKCGGNLELDDKGKAYCKYCNSTYFVEEEKPEKIVLNTTINNFGVEFEDFKDDNIVKTEDFLINSKGKSYRATLLIAGVVVVFVIIFFFANISNTENVVENETIALSEVEKENSTEDEKYSDIEMTFVSEGTDISNIHKMINLKKLYISDGRGIEDYSFLSSLPKLETLEIKSAKNLRDIAFVKNMSNLQNLIISDSSIDDLSALNDKLSLISLELYNNSRLTNYDSIKTLKSLKILKISPVGDAQLPDLKDLKFLEVKEIN